MTATKKNTVKVVNLFSCVTTSLPFLQLVDHCDPSLADGLMDVTVILYPSYLVLTFNVFWCSSWTLCLMPSRSGSKVITKIPDGCKERSDVSVIVTSSGTCAHLML